MTRSLGELARRPSGAPSRRPSCRQEPRDLGQIWQAVRLPQGHCLVTFPKQLRRNLRINVNQSTLGHEEANNLRVMLLGMADDPHVVLIKLADRLHNMRTIYAMPLGKAQAVAQETLVIWCSLASRVGLWALKAELEDLCFAVLQGVL